MQTSIVCDVPARCQEQAVRRMRGFVGVGIAQAVQEVLKLLPSRLWHLQPHQNPAVVCTVIAVMKQRNIPARVHRGEKAHERSRPFRKLELVQALIPSQG